MTDIEFRALTERLRAVVTPDCGDCDGALSVFATTAADHGWNEAVAMFGEIAARHLPPSKQATA